LGRLPKDLKDAYDEIYTAIKNADRSKPEIAIRTFQWVMCSCEPLSAEVLVAAVCQDPEEDETQPIDIDIDFVLDACHNLLVVDPQLGVCRFSHLSVQEYFEEHYWDAKQTNGTVAKVCLLLLNHPDNWERGYRTMEDTKSDEEDSESVYEYAESDEEDTESDEEDTKSDEGSIQTDHLAELLDYARKFWPAHIQGHGETDIDNRLSTLLQKFLGSMNESGPAYRSWNKTYERLPKTRGETLLEKFNDQLKPPTLASLAICLFGFNNVLTKWWQARSMNPEEQNKTGNSLLVLAVLGSSSNVVKNLLELGADVNAQSSSGRYGSALAAAAAAGDRDMIQLLEE
jgi:ankyrin repeat domain-containing protein 50